MAGDSAGAAGQHLRSDQTHFFNICNLKISLKDEHSLHENVKMNIINKSRQRDQSPASSPGKYCSRAWTSSTAQPAAPWTSPVTERVLHAKRSPKLQSALV